MGKWGGATGLPDKTTLRRALRGPAGDADPRAGSGPGGLACLPKGFARPAREQDCLPGALSWCVEGRSPALLLRPFL